MKTQALTLDGTSLAYRESGQGEPVTLVHANISDLRSRETLKPLVGEHFCVFQPTPAVG